LKIYIPAKPDELIAFRLSSGLLKRADEFCVATDINRSQLLRRCLVQFLDRNDLGAENLAQKLTKKDIAVLASRRQNGF